MSRTNLLFLGLRLETKFRSGQFAKESRSIKKLLRLITGRFGDIGRIAADRCHSSEKVGGDPFTARA